MLYAVHVFCFVRTYQYGIGKKNVYNNFVPIPIKKQFAVVKHNSFRLKNIRLLCQQYFNFRTASE